MSDFELLEDTLDAIESDLDFDQELAAMFEDDERRSPVRRPARPVRRPVPTGRGTGYYKPRIPNQNVTQQQLTAALAKISKDVKANAVGVKTVGGRVDTLAAEQKRQADLLRKEVADRKKDAEKMKQNLQLAALLPLLSSKSITVTEETEIGGAKVPANTKLSVAPDGIGALLPLLLLGGDGLGGGDGSSTLLLALAVSGGL